MATMLAFLTTDAAVERNFLDATLRDVADDSFNMMTVDGDTSTNDTLLVLANGLAQNQPINANSPGAQIFSDALREVCVHLAREMARDGEGATRLMIVEVSGAKDKADARKAARTIASSNLVKSAVHGADPNWGRLMMALGRSGAAAEESRVDLFVNGVCIMQEGTPVPFHREAVVAQMRGSEVTFRLDLNNHRPSSPFAVHLAREMARDGEGVTRLMIVEVSGAKDKADARKAARTIASSNLVKSAVHGADPNWGRLMMALGRSGAAAEESRVDLFVNGVCIMQEGTPVPFHRDAVVAQMRGPEVTFRLDLNLGDGSATAWGCDLTEEYVIINSAYTT